MFGSIESIFDLGTGSLQGGAGVGFGSINGGLGEIQTVVTGLLAQFAGSLGGPAA